MHPFWLLSMQTVGGNWCTKVADQVTHKAVQDQVKPLLQDLGLRRMLSSKQLATIHYFYTDVVVSLQACVLIDVVTSANLCALLWGMSHVLYVITADVHDLDIFQ